MEDAKKEYIARKKYLKEHGLASEQVLLGTGSQEQAMERATERLADMQKSLAKTLQVADGELNEVRKLASAAKQAANTAAVVAASVPMMVQKRDPARPGRNMFYVRQMMQAPSCSDPDDFACATSNLNLRNLVKATEPERNTVAEFEAKVAQERAAAAAQRQ
jgi:hypothetical protein